MPNLDGTGPFGQGPVRGNRRPFMRRQRATKECICSKCGHKEVQTRGIPCTEKRCPKCDTPLRGSYCA